MTQGDLKDRTTVANTILEKEKINCRYIILLYTTTMQVKLHVIARLGTKKGRYSYHSLNSQERYSAKLAQLLG